MMDSSMHHPPFGDVFGYLFLFLLLILFRNLMIFNREDWLLSIKQFSDNALMQQKMFGVDFVFPSLTEHMKTGTSCVFTVLDFMIWLDPTQLVSLDINVTKAVYSAGLKKRNYNRGDIVYIYLFFPRCL
jgi:hypothetical protein